MPWGEEIAHRRFQRVAAGPGTRLDLSGLGLTEVPDEIRTLTGLQHLDLSGNELTELPGWLPELDRLDRLHLTDNCFTALPDWLGRLTRLRELWLHDNQLAELPGPLAGIAGLEDLRVGGNDLAAIPDWIGGLTRLKSLWINDCRLAELPAWTQNLHQLAALVLDENDLGELPPALAGLTALSHVSIQGNRFEELPGSLRGLPGLTALWASSNQLKQLPDWIGDLTGLRDLRVESNQLAGLPPSLRALTGLKVLELSDNQLYELPESFSVLARLAVLGIGANHLGPPPDWIGGLHRLGSLSLHYSGLNELPPFIRRLRRLTRLDLRANQIPELPGWIGELEQLRDLSLEGNLLAALPPAMSELSRLTKLDLAANRLTELPEWIGELRRLKHLNISYNKFGLVPTQLERLTGLEQLSIYGTQLTQLPDWISRLRRLDSLDVSENKLTELPDPLGTLDRLTALSIYDNPLPEVPEWIRRLPRLTSLQIGSDLLRELPDWICDLRRLRQLWIADKSPTALPRRIGELRRLTALEIFEKPVSALPESMSELTRLTKLRVFETELARLPEWIGNFKRLKLLEISTNRLASLPDSLGDLPSLIELDAHGNELAEIPESIGRLRRLAALRLGGNRLSGLPALPTRLTRLSLYRNAFEQLPGSIRALRSLTRLNIYDNQLTGLPDWIGELGSLTWLGLDGNRLGGLPPATAGLTRLQDVNLSRNRLREVPGELGGLLRLGKLWLHDNRLDRLPGWLVDLPRLVHLTVHDNPLLSPPPEIASSGPTSTLEFLRACRLGSSRQWLSKMLVVGEGAVGKTTTIKKLLGEPFDPDEATTHGLRVYDYRIAHPTGPNTSMTLNTWDFGGQEIYHATHQFFLTDRSLFLLLWNSRMQWIQGRLRYWLDIIAARAPESPVLLVATNAPEGGRPADLPLDDFKREYPQIVANIAIDNEAGHGLDALRAAIAEQAAGLPLMGVEWPLTWLRASNAVRELPEKHVTPARLWKEMAGAGLRDERHQRYVARALHQLGDILYYEDDPELAETVILRPEWVNEYISRILDSPEVERCQGLLRRDHLNALWADLDRGMREHFLGMMDRYDLSYKVDGGSGGDLSLVVERLPWNAPPYQEKWDQVSADGREHQIQVIYQLNTTPPGIPTWFIARSHRFSTGIHWRTGALLSHPAGHRALIITDTHRNTVELTVRGRSPANFFAVLDDGLNYTLARYPGLSIKRMVPCPCGDGGEACDELFDFDDLERRLGRTPPAYSIECRKSGSYVHVPLLLLGLAPSVRDEWRARLERLENTVSAKHDELISRFEDLSGDLQRQFLKVQQQVQAGLETTCPSVFVITQAKSGRIRGAAYELSLYCEEPGAWHPLPPGTGTYSISESPLWLRRFAPYLRELVNVLKHAAPLVGPVLGVSVDMLNAHVKADVETMKALVDQLPTATARTLPVSGGIVVGDGEPAERAATEADFRALQTLFEQIDPDRRWGGLSRIATPEGLTVYLCPEHAAPYRRVPRSS